MSYKFEAPDPMACADADFDDFFDEPPDRRSPPTSLGQSGSWTGAGDQPGRRGSSDDAKPQPQSRRGKGDVETGKSKKQVADKGKRTSGKADNKTRNSGKSSSKAARSDDSYTEDSDDDTYSSDESNGKQVRKIEAKIPTGHAVEESKRSSKKPMRNSSTGDKSDSASPSKEHSDKNRKHSRSYSSESANSKNSYSDSDYTTDSDSDVTDVSPLNSPHTPLSTDLTRRSENSVNGKPTRGKPPKSPSHKEVTFRQQASPNGDNKKYHPLLAGDSDNIDLKLLMQAVIEMERGHSGGVLQDAPEPPRKVAWQNARTDRKNMSFTNDSVRTIDRENQRLMQQIMRFSKEAKQRKKAIKSSAKKAPPVTNKMSTSAINRNREQKRIEQENFAMLSRLQKARPTSTLSKDALMTDYDHKVLFGCSVAAAHPIPKKKTSPSRTPSPYVVPFDPKYKSRSLTNLNADDTRQELSSEYSLANHNGQRVRPASATTKSARPSSAIASGRKRPQSAKSDFSVKSGSSRSARPAWDDRW